MTALFQYLATFSLCMFLHFSSAQRIVNLHVTSRIQSRFATTHVTSEIQNTDGEDKEITFEAQLPAEAFISNFTMTINGELQVGDVKEKKEARQEYDRARASGQTAGLVEQKARETDRFRTSVNVAAGGKVKFDLTYQEVLKRVHGVYKHVINILSTEAVEDLKIDVFITERGRIQKLHVPNFGPKIGEKTNKELLALPENKDVSVRNTVSEDGFATAKISYEPSTQIAGQLAVLYDLERSFNGGDIEVVDGYFLHFFSPQRDSLPVGATNIVFVLDRSGSMQGKKFQQLKEAMQTILADLKAEDRFSIVWFSTEAEAWDKSLRDANNDNVREALDFVDQGSATGGTNVHGALIEALNILRDDKAKSGSAAPNMILFLTDGLPTSGEIQEPEEIMQAIGSRNRNLKAKVHNLAFGNDADYKMLQKMSSENDGLARKIYEASDAESQLEGFYSEIANPIFTNLNIRYLDGKVNVSSIVKNREDDTFYEGGEVVVTGKLRDPSTQTLRGEIAAQGPDGTPARFRCGNECFSCCRGICPQWCRGWWTCDDPIPRPRPQRIQPPALPANTLRGFVERMWGYMTIKKLLKEADFEGDTPEGKKKKDEALRLSLHYNFVTEVTSMVVVDKEADLAPVEEEEAVEDADFAALPAASFGPSGPAGPRGGFGFGGHGFSSSRISAGNPAPMGLPGPPALPSPRRPGSFGQPGRPRTRPPPPPPPQPQPQQPQPTALPFFPTTLPPRPVTISSGCQLNLLILVDRRTPSNVTRAQILELFENLGRMRPPISGNVAVAELSDSFPSEPRVLHDFSDYHGISSLTSRQSAGTRRYAELVRRLPQQIAARRVALIMNGREELPFSVASGLATMKRQGVEIFAYQSAGDYSQRGRDQLTSLTTDTNHYLYAYDMYGLAYKLKC